MKIFTLTIMTLLLSLLLACDSGSESQLSAEKDKVSFEAGDVLATIDGVEIRESQLETVIVNMFGEYKAAQMDAQSRNRVLDSMLAGYALSKMALVNLPEKNIKTIEEKTRRYRENLLINTYMLTKMDASDLSSEKIKSYYEANLDKFGKQAVKEYQLLTTRTELAEESRDKYLAVISNYINNEKLPKKLLAIKQLLEKQPELQNYDVQLHSGVLHKNLLNPHLYTFINAQALNEVSEITFINNKPYLVIITAEKTINAKTLSEVRDTIRKSLILKQLQQTIKEHSADALTKSNIVYSNR